MNAKSRLSVWQQHKLGLTNTQAQLREERGFSDEERHRAEQRLRALDAESPPHEPSHDGEGTNGRATSVDDGALATGGISTSAALQPGEP